MQTLVMPQSLDTTVVWTNTEKILFRFFCAYFVLYIIVNNNGVVPLSEELSEITINPVMQLIIPWIGKHLLHLPYEITTFSNGSGDTTYDYVIILTLLALSVVTCAVWSVLDRRRTHYAAAYFWLIVAIRYYVGITMIHYGFVKVFKLQFPFPGQTRLLQPYGESSPMGLAWTFMGYSRFYNYFTGYAEVLGGVLLLFRRTATLGALVSFMVMLNVVMMNFCFDIPVKLLSTHLVLMCMFVLAPQIWRLYSFFVLHQSVTLPLQQAPVFRKKIINRALIIVKYTFILFIFFMTIQNCLKRQREYGDAAPNPPLHGIYNTERFIFNTDTLPPLLTDTTRWRRMIVGKHGDASIRTMADSLDYYEFKPDTVKKHFEIISYTDSTQKYTFTYEIPQKDRLTIRGRWNADSIRIEFKKQDIEQFRLVNRGFHWINEYPYNR